MVDHRFAKSVLFVHSSLDDAGLTANEFRVYCHLARRAGSAGDAFPAVQTVADVCRMNRDTVWAVLKSLTARGMLQRVPRSGLSTVYVLTTPEHWHPAETEGHPSDSPSGNEGVWGSGNEGVGPSGNEGVLRESTEVAPPKSIQKHPPRPPHADDVPAAPNRMPASDWSPLQEHRDLAAFRNADIDAQLARFRERNNGQTDTDQGWSVRFRQWLGSARPERSLPREAVASPTVEQWMEFARSVNDCGNLGKWPKQAAEAGWLENQAKGWRYVTDWQADCQARAKRWAANEATQAQRRKS